MANVKELSKKTVRTLKNEGAGVVLRKAKRKIMGTAQPQTEIYTPEDILKMYCSLMDVMQVYLILPVIG